MSHSKPFLFFVISSLLSLWTGNAKNRLPEAPSTLLKMHKFYTQHPPHDTALYDVLEVPPNATCARIARSYRSLSRKFHPDKTKGGESQLEEIREAFEILKDDSTRLPYHQFGLKEISDAAFLLTGTRSPKQLDQNQIRLLRLMGYVPGWEMSYHDRIMFLAANLVERMRPLVEDTITPAAMSDSVIQECMLLKRLPLGSQILRCIGRSYRHAGQRVLRSERFKLVGEIHSAVRKNFHATKHLLEAATVTGKLIAKETINSRRRNVISPRIAYHFEEYDEEIYANDDIKDEEQRKARAAVLESLQVEALWKISKIHLDRVIHDACRKVLEGTYFFFPSHSSPDHRDWNKGGDGWVSTNGRIISTPVAKLRAASALVLIGDTMVKCCAK
jgi:hypothetical protein